MFSVAKRMLYYTLLFMKGDTESRFRQIRVAMPFHSCRGELLSPAVRVISLSYQEHTPNIHFPNHHLYCSHKYFAGLVKLRNCYVGDIIQLSLRIQYFHAYSRKIPSPKWLDRVRR